MVEGLLAAVGPGARARSMMGEYVLYWRERVVGGVYDDRLLLKDLPPVRQTYPGAPLVQPYPGARSMVHIACPRDPAAADQLVAVLEAMWQEIPERRERRPRPGAGGPTPAK